MEKEENENLNNKSKEDLNKDNGINGNEIIKDNIDINENKNQKYISLDNNFEDIYSKINLIKKKHKEHKELDKNNYFSYNDYQIDKLMNDGKLKNLFEMLEPNVKKYKIPYQKSSDFFNSYQNNKFDSNKYNNSNSNTEIFQKNILSNSLNRIYSLNSNINRFQNEISPVNKINVETELSIKRNNKKNSDFNFENIRSLSSNKNNFISNKFLERKYEPLISNNYINDNINDNLNQNFFKSPSNLKRNKPFNNTLKLDYENNYTFNKDNYEKNIYKFSRNWFDKYNKNYYNNEILKLNDAIDKVGNYSYGKNKNKKNVKKNYNLSKKTFH